ncbi:winged helix-turn-helix domain-containing protein [Thalassospira lucentensis]|uniref:winged helix-turn-helix domain-containing protein n=1 Tax=Thalassospira lucentensis TaxID=168935 RepID=UPI00142E281F|nr:crosslink repair DNA glycosylase YcaQ family protein [Thalassospira lucentensis]NIZ01902.1 winged helix-turn-helix domain-containing protein [Thalassospira lucentensis]
MSVSISIKQARNLALNGQGFDFDPRRPVTKRRILKAVRTTNMLQIDSVNVLTRAHYMPIFSRLGMYDPAMLDAVVWGKDRQRALFEYWGHEASMIPVEDYPFYRWRMEDARNGKGMWGRIARIQREKPDLIDQILNRIADDGAVAASDLDEKRSNRSAWWGWSDTKTVMEYLFWSGQVMARHRRNSFERVYDLPERIIGDAANHPPMDRYDAQSELICKGIAAMGVATEADLRKYFRIPTEDAKICLARLVEEGRILRADVQGWKQAGYLCPQVNPRARSKPTCLMVPFDPVMWERDRVERIFGFNYRIEIYVPAEKRQYGYYVLPFMLNGAFVARVDLKADRQEGVLRVQSAHLEEGCLAGDVAGPLKENLERLAAFLGLSGVVVMPANDFSRYLAGVSVF